MATLPRVDQAASGVLTEGKAEEKQPPVYTSSSFFSWSEAFPTAHDFFRTAHQRLKTDCGYSARPSKQKPAKITARCEKQEAGCPFRLCAFLDSNGGKWRVSTRLCVWDHSHPPQDESAPRSAAPEISGRPASPSRPVSDPARTVVLFADGTRFPTPSGFFDKARTRALEEYGFAMHKNGESSSSLTTVCAASVMSKRCRYRVRARRDGATWVVDNANSNLVHNHARRSSAYDAMVTAPTALAKPIATQPESANASASTARSPSKPVKEVPNAPRFNHRFSNVDEAYVAFAVANLRYLGASVWRSGGQHLSVTLYCNRRADVACPFKAVLGPDETESYAVVLPESTLRHNHGPRSQLVDDPSWRPPIRCPLVLAALGGSAPSPVQPSMKRQLSPSHDSQPFKRSRVDAPPQPADKTHGPIASTARTPYPTPPLSVQTPSSIHIPLYGLTSDSAAGVPLEDRVSLVQAFLFGIEPAIAPLASCLVAAGIDSLEALVSLAALSPAIRKVLLEDVDREVAADGQNGLPSAICLVPSFPS
ncbi:hypothetical protein BMF94_0326 [Rhodotorula taiwanensis]|uniref:Uncharacterized protein n=1 Tax=Rhodotorula taiwanensis TaxID=741276 RepID=A0A2S5BIZ4_9BASI|nr:hypothetical protein BMF94_0326 [Rhodotorula taiwanensis]